MQEPPEKSPIALGFEWAGRVFAVCIELIALGAAGIWLDSLLGTSFFVLIGFGLGITVAVTHLILMSKADSISENKIVPKNHTGSNIDD